MKTWRSLFLPALLLMLASGAPAGWHHTTGLYGGTAGRIAVWNDHLVAAVRNNVYLQQEPGVWTRLGRAGESAGDRGLAAPRMLFPLGEALFALCDTTLLLYDPLSDSWTRKGTFLAGEITPFGTSLIALGRSNRLMLSPDSGSTWLVRGPALQCGGILYPWANRLFASTGLGVYVSTDTGMTWQASAGPLYEPPGDPGLPLFQSTLCYSFASLAFSDSGMVSCGLQYGSVYFSADTGRTWTYRSSTGYLGQNSYYGRLAALGQTLLVTGEYGVYRSTDGGRRFIRASPQGASQLLVVDSLVYLTASQLLCSRDSGLTWSPVGVEGVEELACSDLQSDGSHVFARMGYADGVFHCIDTVGYWDRAVNFPSQTFGVWRGRMFSVTTNGLFVSFDRGTTWGFRAAIPFLPTYVGTVCFAYGDPDGKSFLRSSNDGFTWSSVPALPPGTFRLLGTDRTLYSVGYANGAENFWGSSDLGESWGRLNDSLPVYANQLIALRNELYIMGWNALYRSLDGGANWSLADTCTGPYSRFTSMAADSLRLVVASMRDGFPEIRYTGGARYPWVSVVEGLPTRSAVNVVSLTEHALYAGTEAEGIWERALDNLSPVMQAGEPASRAPVAFALEQNYPNPFNPSTTIRYSLPARAQVHLTVFNALGQRVAELLNEEKEPGVHEVHFNAGNLATGIYFYRLTAVAAGVREVGPAPGREGKPGAFVRTRQLMVLR